MKPLTVSPGAVPNHAEIIAMAERYRHLFSDYPDPVARKARPADWDPLNPYRDSEYEDDDRYHVLQMGDMPRKLAVTILNGLATPDSDLRNFYFQINRYDVGDYILPHRDSLQQGLYMLTDSEVDGLVVQSGPGRMEFVPDTAGSLVEHDPSAWHWVDPVRDHIRYTLVTIPARPPAR
ncbi:2OG-Fe(II) oxygenase [Nonomuraea jabiensis]|uniref:2OG-Fe(II) oxygenase n=1 Tax=Nonomuraea jabiensis TaxID=882448 RepID=UPI003412B9B5